MFVKFMMVEKRKRKDEKVPNEKAYQENSS